MSETERIAVCPGSYDPVTNGHLDIISRASRVFDRLVVGVVGSAPRKSGHLFTPEERKELIEDAVAGNGIENVEVRIFRPCWSSSHANAARPRSSRACARSRTSSTSSR